MPLDMPSGKLPVDFTRARGLTTEMAEAITNPSSRLASVIDAAVMESADSATR
jgi:hypothetical protein